MSPAQRVVRSTRAALNEHSRLDALYALGLLDSEPEERIDRVVRIAHELFGVALVAVNLIDADRQVTKSAVGLPLGSLPREVSMCSRAVASDDGLLLVPDLLADHAYRQHPAARSGLRFYAGAVLHAPGGEPIGTLCLGDHEPRELSAKQAGTLRDLADWLETEFANDDEVRHAREMQRRLLPQHMPGLPELDIAGFCLPARNVGGDFFDWQVVHGQLRVSIADVMGKGLSAAMLAAGMRALLRGVSAYNGLADSVSRCAVDIHPDLAGTSSFITVFTAQIDPQTGIFEYVDAGHGLAFVVSPDGSCRRLISDGLPVGAMPEERWTCHTDVLRTGETLIAVSDGVLDASADLQSAMRAIGAAAAAGRDAEDAVTAVAVSAISHSNDDITAVAIRRTDQADRS